MVRATVSKLNKNGINHKKASKPQSTSTNNAQKKTNANSSILSTIAHFSRLQPFKATSFKKTARSVLPPRKTSPLLLSPHTTPTESAEDNEPIFSFAQLYRNTAKLTKFKSKLIDQPRGTADSRTNDERSNGHLSSSQGNGSSLSTKKKTKRVRRRNRRNKLKQQIDTKTIWQMPDKDEHSNTNSNNDAMNGDGPHKQSSSNNNNNQQQQSINVSSMLQSLQETQNEIVEQRKQKAAVHQKRDVEVDKANLVQLFKNDQFDSNPSAFTKQILKQQQAEAQSVAALDAMFGNTGSRGKNGKMHRNHNHKKKKNGMNGFHHDHEIMHDQSQLRNGHRQRNEQEDDQQKKNISNQSNGDGPVRCNGNGHRNGRNGKNGEEKLSDEELKKQICKQLALMKTRKQQNGKTKQQKKAALKSSAAGKLALNKNGKLKHSKHGKFINKKLKKKMTQFDKENQKKRRWRIK